MRRHFAVATNLGNGHVYPILPLCAELVNRGHRVTYVTTEHYEKTISETGAQPVLYHSAAMSQTTAEAIKEGLGLSTDTADDPKVRSAFRAWRQYFFSDALAMLTQVQSFYRENPPDAVLYDRHGVSGRLLANHYQVPAIQTSGHFAYYMNLAVRDNGVCRNPEFIQEWSNDFDEFLSANGVPIHGSYWQTEKLNVHFIPKEFQYHSDYFDDRFCFTGALLNRPYRRVWVDRSRGKPLILVSGHSVLKGMSSDFTDYYRTFVDALSGSSHHCVLSTGPGLDLENLPSDFEVNQHASHLEILPHAALLICHAGMGTTLEALYHGVPTLLLPMSVACREVAYRVEELGLGVQLPPETSAKEIRDTVEQMLGDASLLARVTDARDVFRRSGGEKLAADRIEQYLDSI